MALSQSMMAARFHTEETALFDHKVWVFCGDGDLEEGISHEAASFAGHLGLRHLIVLYDSNDISIEGSTDTTFTDDTEKRFRAYGWEVLTVDGHDIAAIDRKLRRAKRDSACGPVLVICRTTIGYYHEDGNGGEGRLDVDWSPDRQTWAERVSQLKEFKDFAVSVCPAYPASDGLPALEGDIDLFFCEVEKWTAYEKEMRKAARRKPGCRFCYVAEDNEGSYAAGATDANEDIIAQAMRLQGFSRLFVTPTFFKELTLDRFPTMRDLKTEKDA